MSQFLTDQELRLLELQNMESKKNILWKIFISTLYLSAFTFGGATNQTEGVYPY